MCYHGKKGRHPKTMNRYRKTHVNHVKSQLKHFLSWIIGHCFPIQWKPDLRSPLVLAKTVSLVLHCASPLRTIFATLARTNEYVHVQNERFFPQAKLDCEIIVRFLSHEHGDLYFLFHDSVHITLLKL